MSLLTKHLFSDEFRSHEPFEVDAPEFGEGAKCRFKPILSVEDLLFITSVPGWSEANRFDLDIALFMRQAIDENGKPLVELEEVKGHPSPPKWFLEQSNALLAIQLAKRAALRERFLAAFATGSTKRDDDGEADPLDHERLKRAVSDLAVSMNIAPQGVRGWALNDFLDAIESLSKRGKKRKDKPQTDDKG